MISATKSILVAYFSRTGNTREIAKQIHQKIGGDIVEIIPVNRYPDDYNKCVEQAKQELKKGYRPELKTVINNIELYNIIFIGYPNWWGTVPMPVATFLLKYDLTGKTIIPFCTHEGSRLGQSVTDIARYCPKSTVMEGLAIRGSGVKNAQNEINDWLQKLGILK